MIICVPVTAASIAAGSGVATILGPVLLGAGVFSVAGLTALTIVPRIGSPAARSLAVAVRSRRGPLAPGIEKPVDTSVVCPGL